MSAVPVAIPNADNAGLSARKIIVNCLIFPEQFYDTFVICVKGIRGS
jgi:hypothetical protein